jgi:hypothetical protein
MRIGDFAEIPGLPIEVVWKDAAFARAGQPFPHPSRHFYRKLRRQPLGEIDCGCWQCLNTVPVWPEHGAGVDSHQMSPGPGIGQQQPVGESVASPDSGRSALRMFNARQQHANMRRPR